MADREALLGQADSFWKMLDDLAETDPEAYKRFMDRTLKEGSTYLKPPEPCFCISTILLPSVITHQLFVNICGWDQVPAPKTENDPIPVVAGVLQEITVEESTYTVVDIIFNPAVTKGVENSKDRKNLIIHVALDYLESVKNIQVSRKYKILRSKFKGDPKQLRQYIDKQKDHQGIMQSGTSEQKSGVSESPDSLLKQLSSIAVSDTKVEETPTIPLFAQSSKPKKNLIEEVSSTNTQPVVAQLVQPNYSVEVKEATSSKPRRVLVKMDLPEVGSSSQCQLYACKMEISLDVPGMYKLRIKLPEEVDKDQTTAYFNTITHRLTLSLSVKT